MERREEHALTEVDRITAAVDSLRNLLFAAAEADLRAIRKQPPADGPPEERRL
jgi:hypothetical protein